MNQNDDWMNSSPADKQAIIDSTIPPSDDLEAAICSDTVLIAGTIVLGPSTQKVIIRAIGPSLTIAGKLGDPTLELRDANGGLIRANDDWRDGGQEAEIIATTVPPTNNLESAIVATLAGNGAGYTAIVRGFNDTTGVAVVAMYALD